MTQVAERIHQRQVMDLAERAVAALETIADALTRQAVVMEGDVAADSDASTDAALAYARVVHTFGESLENVLDSNLNQFDKFRNLRFMADKMKQHGTEQTR